MKKPLLLLVILLLSADLIAETIEEKNISGTVVNLDWVSSSVTVRYFPAFSTDADEITLKATSDSVIQRSGEDISLSDILQSDPVSVTYYDDGLSGLKIKRLSDLNLASI